MDELENVLEDIVDFFPKDPQKQKDIMDLLSRIVLESLDTVEKQTKKKKQWVDSFTKITNRLRFKKFAPEIIDIDEYTRLMESLHETSAVAPSSSSYRPGLSAYRELMASSKTNRSRFSSPASQYFSARTGSAQSDESFYHSARSGSLRKSSSKSLPPMGTADWSSFSIATDLLRCLWCHLQKNYSSFEEFLAQYV